MILSGADNRPPMLEKDLYDSWKSQIELYMQNREHRIMIFELVKNGPLIWHTIEENKTENLDTYDSDCDDISNANVVLMANISNHGSNVISEFYLKKAQRIKPTLYDGIIIYNKHVAMPVIDDDKTLILEDVSRSKMAKKPLDNALDFAWIFKIDLVHLAHKLLQNREAHIDYLKLTQEQADILWGIVKQAKAKQSLDNALDFAWIFKIDLVHLAPKLLQNREAHIDYLKLTQEQADILWGIVKQAKAKQPLDNALDFASPKLLQNREVHIDYLNLTQEQADILWGIVKQAKAKQPLDNTLDFASVLNMLRNIKKPNIWKPTGHVFTEVGFKWKPTGRTFTIVGNSLPLTRITSANVVPPKQTTSYSIETQKPDLKVYSRKPKNVKNVGSIKKSKITESKNASHSELNHTWGSNVLDIPSSSSLVMTGYPDCSLVFGLQMFETHDMEPLSAHELCVDLISRSRDTNLFTISLDDMLKTSLIFLLSKASKTKSWLWHRQLSHLNVGTLNKLAKDGLAQGIPRLKFQKYHICSACALGKSKKSFHQPKAEGTNQEKLYLLHMDLCGPMRVASINRKMYILMIVDDYSIFTWVRFLRTKDEAPEAIIKCIKNIQVCLNAKVRNVRTDNETEFVNHTLSEFYENVGISHQTYVVRTPQQNDIVERNDWDHLFQPMFDEYFNPSIIVDSPVPVAAAPRAVDLADSPVSTSIDQDAPSTSIPST
nr:ribonuclease H-like domain-containing protein [Tanacetum cinerariifolium]